MKLAFAFLLAGIYVLPAFAQTPNDITSDPHHDLLLQNDQVRVFEVSLRSGERTFVNHEHNFLVVMLQNCEIVIWSAGKSDILHFRFNQGETRFFFGGAVGFRNDETEPFRAILVEFLDAKVTSFGYQASGNWEYGPSGLNPPVDPHAKFSNSMKLGTVVVTDVQLLQNDSYPSPEKDAPELLIPVTDVELAKDNGRIRKSSGEISWIAAGRKEKLVNDEREPARFVVVEFRGE